MKYLDQKLELLGKHINDWYNPVHLKIKGFQSLLTAHANQSCPSMKLMCRKKKEKKKHFSVLFNLMNFLQLGFSSSNLEPLMLLHRCDDTPLFFTSWNIQVTFQNNFKENIKWKILNPFAILYLQNLQKWNWWKELAIKKEAVNTCMHKLRNEWSFDDSLVVGDVPPLRTIFFNQPNRWGQLKERRF